jgi:hypothetical protein
MPGGRFGAEFFLNFSLYQKKATNMEQVAIYEGNGALFGMATPAYRHNVKHIQLGFHGMFGSDDDVREKPRFFWGTGLAFVHAKHIYTYEMAGAKPASQSKNGKLFGLNLSCGWQYYLNPVIIRLQGNLDFMGGEFESADEEGGAFVSGAKLGVLLPLTKGVPVKKVKTKANKKTNSKQQVIL